MTKFNHVVLKLVRDLRGQDLIEYALLAASFAVARVIVEETPGHPWVHVLLYGVATGVAIARVTSENPFPSDALVGSVIGYSVGGYVYHHHSAFYVPKVKALRIAPLYNPATASYGVSLSLKP